jgi:hypothetical protein
MHLTKGRMRTVTGLVSNGGMHLTRGRMRTSWFKNRHRVGLQLRDTFNKGTDANLYGGIRTFRFKNLPWMRPGGGQLHWTDANNLVQELTRDGCEPIGSRTVTGLVSNGGMNLARGLVRTSWFKNRKRVGFQ